MGRIVAIAPIILLLVLQLTVQFCFSIPRGSSVLSPEVAVVRWWLVMSSRRCVVVIKWRAIVLNCIVRLLIQHRGVDRYCPEVSSRRPPFVVLIWSSTVLDR